MGLRILFIVLFFMARICLFCQSDDMPDIIISAAEYLTADDPDPEAAAFYIEQLMDLIDNKVNINSADEQEIARIFFLTEFQVSLLADYVRKTGGISTAYEIAYIPGFDAELARLTAPFLSFEKTVPSRKRPLIPTHSITTNITYRKDNDTVIPDLTSIKSLTKYRLAAGGFAAALTMEKDAGEVSAFRSKELPDFLSGYISYEGKGVVRRIIAGDFSVRTGQGTNTNTGYTMLSSLLANDFMAGKNDIRAYSSTNENNFFRGAAASIHIQFADIVAFYSQNRIDATLNYSADSVPLSADNLYLNGLHDTPATVLKKDVLTETAAGAAISFNIKNLRLGLTFSESQFSLPFNSMSDELRNLGTFSGKSNYLFSTDYKWLYKYTLFFGELTYNGGGGYAFMQGLKLKPDNRLTINLTGHKYRGGFHSFHAASAGGIHEINETSLNANMLFEAARGLFLSAGNETIWYPWLEYSCDQPSNTMKHEVKAGYYPTNGLSVELLYRFNRKTINSDIDYKLDKGVISGYRDLKAVIRYAADRSLNTCTRVEYKSLTGDGGNGFVLAQDLNLSFRNIPLRIWLRYSIFDTDNYDSRIYVYENDLINSFSVPGLSGKGSRSYIMVSWKIKRSAEIRFKYGITTLKGTSGITTDREEFRFQLRLSL